VQISSGSATFLIESYDEWLGNHASQSTAGSRPVLQQDGAGKYYLAFDGTDDFLVTGTITPGADKAQVFVGVRKASDAASGQVLEWSSSFGNAGTFAVSAPNGAASNYRWVSGGSLAGAADVTVAGYVAPTTNVLGLTSDISGDSAIVRVNGAQVGQSTADQGTGNFTAQIAYIGRRAGTAFPFNGNLYSMIVRFGANLTADQIAQAETFVNGKTGAY